MAGGSSISADLAVQIDALTRRRGGFTQTVVKDRSSTTRTLSGPGDLESLRARLRAPLQAQAAFLDTASISDEWRTF